jgi:hypothetical protein
MQLRARWKAGAGALRRRGAYEIGVLADLERGGWQPDAWVHRSAPGVPS